MRLAFTVFGLLFLLALQVPQGAALSTYVLDVDLVCDDAPNTRLPEECESGLQDCIEGRVDEVANVRPPDLQLAAAAPGSGPGSVVDEDCLDGLDCFVDLECLQDWVDCLIEALDCAGLHVPGHDVADASVPPASGVLE